ncbi:site-specific DNA-methyltransferase [Succinimonas amylolytica]|uniref:site-specific DNA-methyltransferase n=1 Tax=Succinimonas amylolytica TaxID=83769 RepID=UPI00036263DF|nr:site-specific DNA-methyltransferase [Succinimonas amylolytica]
MELQYPGKRPLQEIREELLAAAAGSARDIPSDFKTGLAVTGDNYEVMLSLLRHFAGKIDLVYTDPPFNTRSCFFRGTDRVSTVSHGSSDRVAYNDSMPMDEYLEFMRVRLCLIHLLLSESGSLYLHIDNRAGPYLRILLDEVFGMDNFLNDISRVKCNPKNFSRAGYGNCKDVIYLYAKNRDQVIFNGITEPHSEEDLARLFKKKDARGRRYTTVPCHAPGESAGDTGGMFRNQLPPPGRHWRYAPDVLAELDEKGLIEWSANGVPRIIRYADDAAGKKIQDIWLRYKDPQYPRYPTEKNSEMLEMIIRQSSRETSLIMDPFAGSGSFLAAGVRLGRRVIGIDSSSEAMAVISGSPELSGFSFAEVSRCR